jgi:uncharacterized protein
MNSSGSNSEFKSGTNARGSKASEIRLQMVNVTRQKKLATSVEVASSGARRSKGLLGRKGLAPGEGLWIVPCEAVHTFGMQFSLDLVYLDRKHRIRKIKKNVPPWRISACLTAHSVVELPAGSILDADAQPGDVVELLPA